MRWEREVCALVPPHAAIPYRPDPAQLKPISPLYIGLLEALSDKELMELHDRYGARTDRNKLRPIGSAPARRAKG